MKLGFAIAGLALLAACDVPPQTPEEIRQNERQQQELQSDLYRQNLDLDCFSGDQKACENQQKLQEIDAIGNALEDVATAANASG